MVDIELVIKINEKDYNDILNGETKASALNYATFNAITNGTPLPKGHGRLIDADSIDQIIRPLEASDSTWGMTAETAIRLIHEAFNRCPTIIEAETEET